MQVKKLIRNQSIVIKSLVLGWKYFFMYKSGKYFDAIILPKDIYVLILGNSFPFLFKLPYSAGLDKTYYVSIHIWSEDAEKL